MADEEDFSRLPLPDRFVHKNWKVRKEGYEAAAKDFDTAQTEHDPIVRQFIQDASLWKGAVADSNVAAQQEGMGALIAFLNIAGPEGCKRTRGTTVAPLVEKGLGATRPAAKQKALEALMLYIELDKPDPIIEELQPFLSHKQPKIIAATLNALTQIFHAYGCKTIEPKTTLKILPKVFGHADKNVRAEAQNLTVEFYRWLKDAMKPLFWNDLKPVQQQDLEKLFEKVKDEPPPQQERLLRSQQAAKEAAAAAPAGGDDGGAGGDGDDEEANIDLEPEYMAVDVLPKVPKDLQERLGSSKWKDRKEACEDLFQAVNVPAIEEGPFDDIVRSMAKCMKDANIMVVTIAANVIEALAKGLRKSFAKYRATIMNPMMERLKEKKQAVADAIGAALDAVFASTSFGDCLEEILEFLKHKNPQVKLESTRFLIRCLKNTRTAPQLPELKSIAEASTKLLTESQEIQRNAGAEVLGTLWKIMGDRIMNTHLDGLDDIRKAKVKEYYDAAEVKSKYKPKAAPAPKAAAAPAGKRPVGKKPAAVKKTAPPPAAAPEPAEEAAPALAPRPTTRPPGSKLAAPKSGLAAPSGLRGLQKKAPGVAAAGAAAGAAASPRRPAAAPPAEEPPAAAPPPAQSKIGGGIPASRGLAGRSLAKPSAAPTADAPAAPAAAGGAASGLTAMERAELAELRNEVERMRRQMEELRAERTSFTNQVHELQNQNAQLIEDHTRDVLSIKAKETQLVRARSDHEAAEQTVLTQQREVERLKRELSRQVRSGSPTGSNRVSSADGVFSDSAANGYADSQSVRSSRSYGLGSPGGEGKENFVDPSARRNKLSGGYGAGTGLGRSGSRNHSGGRESPGFRGAGGRPSEEDGHSRRSGLTSSGSSGAPVDRGNGAGGAESWKRAAEVTQNLKARIEQMKAKQGLGKPAY